MPIFWFVSFANRIKRIRDKTFCSDVRLAPNPCSRHTSCIHGAGCNSGELCGICMSEVPLLLLRKRATIGLLSQNLFCHLHANGKWLIILESLKKKKKKKKKTNTGALTSEPNKQQMDIVFMVSIKGSCLKLLWVTCSSSHLHFFLYLFWWGSCLRLTLVSFSISTSTFILSCLHVQFPEDMCMSSLDWWIH